MMKLISNNLPVEVALTPSAHRLAKRFKQQQPNAKKAKQVYLNTLAIYAVNYYLNCLDIDTDLDAGESWNPLMQTLANTADLMIKNVGLLECRPVLPDSQSCYIPAEVWSERIGYVAVQLNPSLTKATLLGFIEKVASEELSLNQFQSIEHLLIQIDEQVVEHKVAASLPILEKNSTTLHKVQQTLKSIFQTVEPLLDNMTEDFPQLAAGYRSSPEKTAIGYMGSDVIDFGLPTQSQKLTLNLALMPQDEIDSMEVLIEIHSTQQQRLLPADLHLRALDEQSQVILSAKAEEKDTNIGFEFTRRLQEPFIIQLALGDFTYTKTFNLTSITS